VAELFMVRPFVMLTLLVGQQSGHAAAPIYEGSLGGLCRLMASSLTRSGSGKVTRKQKPNVVAAAVDQQ